MEEWRGAHWVRRRSPRAWCPSHRSWRPNMGNWGRPASARSPLGRWCRDRWRFWPGGPGRECDRSHFRHTSLRRCRPCPSYQSPVVPRDARDAARGTASRKPVRAGGQTTVEHGIVQLRLHRLHHAIGVIGGAKLVLFIVVGIAVFKDARALFRGAVHAHTTAPARLVLELRINSMRDCFGVMTLCRRDETPLLRGEKKQRGLKEMENR